MLIFYKHSLYPAQNHCADTKCMPFQSNKPYLYSCILVFLFKQRI